MPLKEPQVAEIDGHKYRFHSIPALPDGTRIYRRVMKALMGLAGDGKLRVASFFSSMDDDDLEIICSGILKYTDCLTYQIGESQAEMRLEQEVVNRHFGGSVSAMLAVVFKGVEFNYLDFLGGRDLTSPGVSSTTGSGTSKSEKLSEGDLRASDSQT